MQPIRLILIIIGGLMLLACDKSPTLTPLASDAVILAFGDSLTYGTGVNPETQSYPAVLAGLINRKVINAGIPGEVSAAGLQRLPNMLKKFKPQLVILCHGANDILRKQNIKQTEENLGSMISLIEQSGAQVILIAVPDFNLLLKPAEFYQRVADQYQLAIENDIISQIERKSSLKSDPIHPNVAGYKLMAERLQLLLQESGGV